VSVKVPEDLKDRMKRLGIRPAKVLRKAIEDEVRKEEAKLLDRKLERLRPVLDKVSPEEVVKSIREDRDKR
jgi:predicted transcriptional regulator